MSRQTLQARSIFYISALFVASVCAADFPSKPIQLVVPYGAGPGDSLARIMSICLTPRLKQPVLVVNKPGANAVLGAKFVSTAAPDGHTIILAASATVTDLVTSQNPAFDVRTELEPVTKLGSGVQGVYVNSSLPIQSMTDLVNYAKARPGQLNYATAGVGSVNHVSTEALSTTTGIKMTHVPFPGGTGPFLSAMMGGVIEVAMTDMGGAQAALDSGKIRLIGVMSKERLQSRPNVPTVIESFPSMLPYLGTLWFGFFAPPKTPKDIMTVLHTELVACLNEPTTRVSLKKFGYEDSQIVANTPEQFRTSILEDIARLKDIVQRANIQLR